MTKRALVTGVTGQDGSYLVELLLEKGYEVHGLVRRCSSFSTGRIEHLIRSNDFNSRFFYHWGDLTDACNLNAVVQKVQPDEIYNLGAQSHVKVSFDVPEFTADVDAMGTLRLLDAARNFCPDSRFYQASTSEMYGGVVEEMPPAGYSENTPFHPRSPYGVAKLYAYWIVRNYREAYGTYACNGLLFNHESPRRGETFVTRKITRWFSGLYKHLKNPESRAPVPLELGNLYAIRDWGHAKDFVEAQWLMLQQEKPEDFVVATGETHTVKEFVETCFSWLSLPIGWRGEGEAEEGWTTLHGRPLLAVRINPRYYRPAEVDLLKGDSSKIRALGWKPKHDFHSLVDDMMHHDCLMQPAERVHHG